MISKVLLFLISLSLSLVQPLCAEQKHVIETDEVVVVFSEPLRLAAQEVVDIYPALKAELQRIFGWKLDFVPTIVLVKDRSEFQRAAGTHLVAAFAVPERNLTVLDYSRMNTHPFTLGITLKHELAHLLLHRYISRDNLPTWLDEGVSQWVSDGVAEIVMAGRRSVLDTAILSKRHIGIKRLSRGFPRDEESLLLAYEQSKSLVDFIVSTYGREEIITILGRLKDGDGVETAILKSLAIPLAELETRWHDHLRKRITWLTYLSRNLYEVLFFLAALVAIGGFIRLLIKKRRYQDSEGDGDLRRTNG